ncbi:MAG: hypothetical protein AAF212_05055 [Verrucomicrobiota bacterium]
MSTHKNRVWVPIVTEKTAEIQETLHALQTDSGILVSEDRENPVFSETVTAIDLVIILISNRSLTNSRIHKAIDYALQNEVRILPIILESALDFSQIPGSINSIQWLELWDPSTRTKRIERMLRSIKTDYEHLETLRSYDKLADTWLSGNKQKDLLLRGKALSDAENWLIDADAHYPRPNELIEFFISMSRDHADAIQARNERILKVFWSFIGIGTVVSVIMAILIFQDTLQIQEDEREAEMQKQRAQGMIEYLVAELDDPLIELEQTDTLSDIVNQAEAYVARIEAQGVEAPKEIEFLKNLKRAIQEARGKIAQASAENG